MRPCSIFLTGMILAASGTVLAGRPLANDDADPADPGVVEVETGVSYEKDGGSEHWHVPVAVTYGLLPSIEIGIEAGGRLAKEGGHSEEDFTDVIVAAKWQFLKEQAWLPRMALAPAILIPVTSTDRKVDGDLNWIASKTFGEKLGAHINIGYGWIGQPENEEADDVLHYGFALDFLLTDTLQWVGEVYAERECKGGSSTTTLANTGLRWNPSDALTVDCAAATKLSHEGPDLMTTIGLTWAFGGE